MPLQCNKTDLENLLPIIIKLMKSTNFFSLDNQNKEINIIPQQLELVDSVQQNKDAKKFRFMNFVAFLIIFIFFSLVVGATVMSWMHAKEQAKLKKA